ncbi:adenylyl-sulfate kinase [Candidatus Purcelliella pentastirinorum]|uniref:Adenylyl-sulfate kinase n=1 Tax=Candidatus Purcelliella pentastirinorum TaxID=472834 RepID=A0A346DZ80_9ENTR|nr:adenylyl-sulfate kinase [Candidatus Purcelliella pentastirinorum]AXN02035.1 Adenylylsulfate kinase [Candidatus Purcelliella pentastirinorum]WDI79001.1 adenylyl-sulfate kinase [Candidatus Purcelliella pentastirinorum]WDR80138.1 adenylyl-sulfate kinase [Candidatus Purcelliella pentastirinorum]
MIDNINKKNKNNVIWQYFYINKIKREKLNNHKSALLWFTGLSGSGKSTIANALEKKLYFMNIHTYILDGDNIRSGLCSDLSFIDKDRKENIRRVGEVSKLMVDAGLIVLSTFISPHRFERKKIRYILGKNQFIEIFIDTSFNLCKERDSKGLYKKVSNKKIKNFTGVDSVYELPVNPEIILNGEQKISVSVNKIILLLKSMKII